MWRLFHNGQVCHILSLDDLLRVRFRFLSSPTGSTSLTDGGSSTKNKTEMATYGPVWSPLSFFRNHPYSPTLKPKPPWFQAHLLPVPHNPRTKQILSAISLLAHVSRRFYRRSQVSQRDTFIDVNVPITIILRMQSPTEPLQRKAQHNLAISATEID
jgi:hypothetical protein